MIYQVMTGIRFIVLWIIGSIAAMLATLTAAFFAVIVLSIALGFFYITGGNTASPLMHGLVIAAFGVVGAVMGLTLGSIQKSVMTQKYGAELRWWRRLSTLSGAVGMTLTAFALSVPIKKTLLTLTLPDPRVFLFYGILPILIPMVCLSIAQWFVLNRYVYGAWAWILANAVAAVVFYSLLMGIYASGMILTVIPVLLVATAPAIVTGFALLWLFQFNARGTWPDEFY